LQTRFFRNLLEFRPLARRGRHDVRSGAHQPEHHRPADSTTATGDDCDLSHEIIHRPIADTS
jgi:hypothetical protein